MIAFDRIADLALDPANGWSIGSFGAIGEFVRDPDEPVEIRRATDRIELVTPRGALRIAPTGALVPIGWDTLSGDGESWGHALAFCCPCPQGGARGVRALGPDGQALRPEDRGHRLFDLGVGCGAIVMAVRTADAGLTAALDAAEGAALLACPAAMGEVLRAQPHRVLLSPAGRIEVYQPIPPADGASPAGPHTHLLPKLIAKDRPHSANTPIPAGLQSALSLHPPSPWRTAAGERHPFRPDIDAAFAPLLKDHGLAEDAQVDAAVRRLVAHGAAPAAADWPQTRRGRTKARIVLRRLEATGDERVRPWRALFDRGAGDDPEDPA